MIFNTQNRLDILTYLLWDMPEEVQRIKDFYGEDDLRSNHDLYNLILNTSPNQITVFTLKKEVMAKYALVLAKRALITVERTKGGIYSFTTENIKGFQFGDPEISNAVYIHFFDNEGNHYDILVKGNQDEIDFILSSIEPL